MITTARQLKDKVANLTKDLTGVQKSEKAQILIRYYFMECLLGRVSKSKYKDSFILKGGMLVASYMGLDSRATKDIDTTIMNFDLKEDAARKVFGDIIKIDARDSVCFEIISCTEIMEDFDYPGLRIVIEASFDKIKDSIKIDMSTDDIITPGAVDYNYSLMFDDRTIPLRTYNIETLLAEKMQTIVFRGTANIRIRDFYDIYMLTKLKWNEINFDTLRNAYSATSNRRGTIEKTPEIYEIIEYFKNTDEVLVLWNNFKKANYFVGNIVWQEIMESVESLSKEIITYDIEQSESETEELSTILM